MDTIQSMTVSGFQFSGVPIVGNSSLDSNNYTLAEVICDDTGSLYGKAKEIEEYGLKNIVKMVQSVPTSARIMLRMSKFSTVYPKGVQEIHGMKLVRNCDLNDYNGVLKTSGGTPLAAATLYGIEAAEKYGKDMYDQEYDSNAVIYIITDGEETQFIPTTSKIKETINRIRQDEKGLVSIITVLIGVGTKQRTNVKTLLDKFKDECGIDSYIDIEDTTPSSLGKLGQIISQSLSSASKNVNSKDTSQTINALTI